MGLVATKESRGTIRRKLKRSTVRAEREEIIEPAPLPIKEPTPLGVKIMFILSAMLIIFIIMLNIFEN